MVQCYPASLGRPTYYLAMSKYQQFKKQQPSPKLDAYLHTLAQLESHSALLLAHIAYYQQASHWLGTALAPPPRDRPAGTMVATSRLNVLMREGMTVKVGKQGPVRRSTRGEEVRGLLGRVLGADESGRVQALLDERSRLYARIEQSLQQQEPYLHEKLSRRIQREARHHTKLSTLAHLQRLCRQKQHWLQSRTQQISNKTDEKLVEQQATGNLLRMKQIMHRKISNSEYAATVADPQNWQRLLARLGRMGEQVADTVKQQITRIQSDKIESEYQQYQEGTVNVSNKQEFDEQFIQELNQTLLQSQQLLSKPLTTPFTQALLQQCLQLEDNLASLRRPH